MNQKQSMVLAVYLKAFPKLGAKVVKINETHIYIDIPKGVEIDNDEMIQRIGNILPKITGLKLKYKNIS